jgi:hypothetical protein
MLQRARTDERSQVLLELRKYQADLAHTSTLLRIDRSVFSSNDIPKISGVAAAAGPTQ